MTVYLQETTYCTTACVSSAPMSLRGSPWPPGSSQGSGYGTTPSSMSPTSGFPTFATSCDYSTLLELTPSGLPSSLAGQEILWAWDILAELAIALSPDSASA